MTFVMPVPRSILDDQQSELAHREYEDHADSFWDDICDGVTVPDGPDEVTADHHVLLSHNVLAPAVRLWAKDNCTTIALRVAFYLDDSDAHEFRHERVMYDEEAVTEDVCFSPLVLAEFPSRDAAMLFKLTWGGHV